MSAPYIVPSSAAPFILFQRTQYLRLINTLPVRVCQKLLPALKYNRLIHLEARLRNARVRSMYLRDMEAEYLSLKDFLPEKCSRILDIGCGIAGIDIFLNRHYRRLNQEVEFLLLDKSQVEDSVYYMYKSKGAFYNSLETAKELLVTNEIDDKNLTLIEATESNTIETDKTVDLAFSLISWGFHYPVSTYLARVYELLNSGGRLILDVRKETDGLDALKHVFGHFEIVLEASKYLRVCSRK